MLLFPNCKINLGLNITGKRADGFHEIETVFYPVGLRDALELIGTSAGNTDIQFQSSGLAIEGDPADNLCVKAYRLLQKDFPQLPPVQIYLHKAIPMGAGLGGGSADGAGTLLLLNQHGQLHLSEEQLNGYALQLGSDCPFFIHNKPCLAGGRGEKLEEIPLTLSGYQCLMVHPGIHISTAWAFSQIIPAKPREQIKDIIREPAEKWKGALFNDFELPVMAKYPEIGKIKEQLYQNGAIYASLTGSGSTVFGLFPLETRVRLEPYQPYWVSLV